MFPKEKSAYRGDLHNAIPPTSYIYPFQFVGKILQGNATGKISIPQGFTWEFCIKCLESCISTYNFLACHKVKD